MPKQDKTGPQGKGPKTGRQRGNCEGAEPKENFGKGCGRRNRPCRRGFKGQFVNKDDK